MLLSSLLLLVVVVVVLLLLLLVYSLAVTVTGAASFHCEGIGIVRFRISRIAAIVASSSGVVAIVAAIVFHSCHWCF